MSHSSDPLPGTVPDPRYPDSDGEPAADSDFHLNAMIWLRQALQFFFARVPDVYVATDLFWYWEEGNPEARMAPDAMVVKGVGKHLRLSFRSWEEGGARPCTIFEIASERNWRENLEDKRLLYAGLGVPEYFIFDPEGPFMTPVLQGFRLQRGRYVALRPTSDGSVVSRDLGLRLTPEGPMLRLRAARSGRRIFTCAEQTERANRKAERYHKLAEQHRQFAEQQRQLAEQHRQFAEQQGRLIQETQRRTRKLKAETAALQARYLSAKPGQGDGDPS